MSQNTDGNKRHIIQMVKDENGLLVPSNVLEEVKAKKAWNQRQMDNLCFRRFARLTRAHR